MRQRKRAWALVGCLVAVLSVCAGMLYHFAQGPTCWNCWSGDHVNHIRGYMPLPEGGMKLISISLTCRNCHKNWKEGSPWAATSCCEHPVPVPVLRATNQSERETVDKVLPIPSPPLNLRVGEVWYPSKDSIYGGGNCGTAGNGKESLQSYSQH